MIVQSFKEDLLGYEEFAGNLERFIAMEHHFVQGSLVLSLNARFGSGKSTFLDMWSQRLAELDSAPTVVRVNAWDDDYCGDPLVSLVAALIDSFDQSPNGSEELKDAARSIGWFTLGLANEGVKRLAGIDVAAAGKFAEEKLAQQRGAALPSNLFDQYQIRKQALRTLKEAIANAIKQSSTPTILMVDELDRCRPDYAIAYLETIKHIFDVENLTFVIAVDRKQLECSAKAAFGQDLDFPEYFRKFVHREVELPAPSSQGYRKVAEAYTKFYLDQTELRGCLISASSGARLGNIVELIAGLAMSPRQIQESFRLMGHALQTSRTDSGQLFWGIEVGTLLMAILKVASSDAYRMLGRNEWPADEAAAFFKRLPVKRANWWFSLCLTGGGLLLPGGSNDSNQANLDNMYRLYGLLPHDSPPFDPQQLSGFLQAWDYHGENRFVQIREKIEHVASWGASDNLV